MAEDVDQPSTKRPKFTPAVIVPESDTEKNRLTGKKKSTKTVKNRRQDKADSKTNNKGLIGASMLLSAVGMLNYMGN